MFICLFDRSVFIDGRRVVVFKVDWYKVNVLDFLVVVIISFFK